MGLLLAAFQEAKLLSVFPISTSNLPLNSDHTPSNEYLELNPSETALRDQIKAFEAEKEALRAEKDHEPELPNADIPRDGGPASKVDPVLDRPGSHDNTGRASIRENERVPNRQR